MSTFLSTMTASRAAQQRRNRKATTKSTLAVETLDKRQMLTSWSTAYPTTSYWSMPQTTSAYAIPSSWSMPTYSSYGSYSSTYSPYSTNTYGYGSSLYGTFSSPTPANYSTSSFLNTSSYFTPTSSTFGTSSFSTPTYSSYSPYGSSYASSNVYTTRTGSSYYGTYSPSTYSSSGSSWASSTGNAMANLQSSYNQLQQLNSQLQHMGGTPVSVPSSVTSTLNNFYSGSFGSSSSNSSVSTTPYREPSQIVLAKPTYKTSYDWSSDASAGMIRSSTDNLFGSGGIVDAVKRTSNAINKIVQPVATVVQKVYSPSGSRSGGGFAGMAARRW